MSTAIARHKPNIITLSVIAAVYMWLFYSFVILKDPSIARTVYIMLLCFGGGYLISRYFKYKKSEVFEYKPHPNPIALTIGLSLLATAIMWGTTLLFRPGLFDPGTISEGLKTCGTPLKNYWLIAGAFALLNPFAEEWLWRKNVFPYLRTKMSRNWAIFVSAILFAGYHPLAIILLFPPLWLFGVFTMCFIGGIFLVGLFLKTHKMRYSVALHMVININLIFIWFNYTAS